MKVQLRSYQKRALEKALKLKRCVIVMPTGSGKTIVAGAWLEELFKRNEIRKALVLEPTRILVEQNSLVLREKFELDARPLHGGKRDSEKRRALEGKVVVSTPEEAEVWLERLKDAEALVVDECHHTVGKDPYVKVVSAIKAEWRLGLTAFVPTKRRALIEKYLGPIVEFDWTDEEIRKYLPPLIGEVYEAPLSGSCRKLYEKFQEEWLGADRKKKNIVAMAMRFLARDGALALYESSKKETKLGKFLKKYERLLEECVKEQPLHKFDALKRALDDHDFDKALVFVDRVIIAKEVARKLNAVTILGKRAGGMSLEEVRRAKLIVSTSAGEEGVDLPEVDLLVIWSNTASSLRLIQRIGRLLRPKGTGRQKFLVFIATPETVDMDLLIEGIEFAKKVGVDPNVDPQLLRRLLMSSSVGSVLEMLEGRALPEDILAEVASTPLSRVRRILKRLAKEGVVAYIHSPYGKLWFLQEDAEAVAEEYPELVDPAEGAEVRVLEHNLKGKPEEVAQALKKRVPTGPLSIEVRIRTNYMEIYDLRKYTFTVSREEVAELVVKNASSKGLHGLL